MGGMGEWMKEWMRGWTKGTARGGRKAKKMGRVGIDRLPFMLVVEGPIFFGFYLCFDAKSRECENVLEEEKEKQNNETCDEMKRMNERKKKRGMGGCKGRFAAVA